MPAQAIIATRCQAAKIENLRRISYHNSKGFKVINEHAFEIYCRWSPKDDKGVVLAVLNEQDEVVSSLRGNVYFGDPEHTSNNSAFAGCTENFVTYPVLDMTFAATAPEYFESGFLSVLRYYMYRLHRYTVKSISGQVVKDSILYFTLQKLGYRFREIDRTRLDVKAVNNWTLASLDTQKFDAAIETLTTKYLDTIEQVPLVIH